MDSLLFSTRKTAVAAFIAAILIVGVLRVTVSLAGVPDRITTFLSMSAVIVVGMIYFGIMCTVSGGEKGYQNGGEKGATLTS